MQQESTARLCLHLSLETVPSTTLARGADSASVHPLSSPLAFDCAKRAVLCLLLLFTDAADVHSPGVPRDCAALESLDEPDLTALAAAAGRQGTAGGTAAGTAPAENAGHRPEAAAAVDMDAALSRLQEVGLKTAFLALSVLLANSWVMHLRSGHGVLARSVAASSQNQSACTCADFKVAVLCFSICRCAPRC